MSSTILVPLDGSPLAEQALPFARRLAEATAARLILTRVLPLVVLHTDEADLDEADSARAYVQRMADQLAAAGVEVRTATPWGDRAAQILEQVHTQHIDQVVMATHGRSGPGRWLYGSVADAVLRQSPAPLVLVPPEATAAWPSDRPLRILVPLDGSELAEAVLDPVQALAGRLGAEIVLLQVVFWPPVVYGDAPDLIAYNPDEALTAAQAYLADVATRLTIPGVRCRTELGRPAAGIIQVGAEEQIDLIAMATHGRSGLARLVLGSVATGTLQRSSVPLLLVRPAARQAEPPPVPASADVPTVPAGPLAHVALSPRDLDLLERGLGELLYKPGGDPALAPAVRELARRLSQAAPEDASVAGGAA